MTVGQFAKEFGLNILSDADLEREITGGYVGDLLSWVMSRAQAGDAWITIMSNINITAVAALTDVACIIIAEGVVLDEQIIAVAKEKGINLLSSDMTAFRLAGILSAGL